MKLNMKIQRERKEREDFQLEENIYSVFSECVGKKKKACSGRIYFASKVQETAI